MNIMNNTTTTFTPDNKKITLQVSKDPAFRRELAKALVRVANPGCLGYFCADPVEGKVYYTEDIFDNPWSDDVDWRIICVDYLGDPNSDYSEAVDDWGDLLTREIKLSCLASQDKELEENDDIPEWLSDNEVIDWASSNINGFKEKVEEVESAALEVAITLAESDIIDEVTIDLESGDVY